MFERLRIKAFCLHLPAYFTLREQKPINAPQPGQKKTAAEAAVFSLH
ncbi:hypothetical protein [Stutzerimonas stutzeri]|nr:hypothetical protein [Stutzerimonas stutzeri]QUE75420.1 hypothetical protein KCX70_19640 [Stutzerimonas stutzeri]